MEVIKKKITLKESVPQEKARAVINMEIDKGHIYVTKYIQCKWHHRSKHYLQTAKLLQTFLLCTVREKNSQKKHPLNDYKASFL